VGSTIPFILLTAHDEPELRERALRAKCAAYLRKTEPADVLLSSIRAALRSSTPDPQ
jgi:DNA-binding NarL/FixJ family response regulator